MLIYKIMLRSQIECNYVHALFGLTCSLYNRMVILSRKVGAPTFAKFETCATRTSILRRIRKGLDLKALVLRLVVMTRGIPRLQNKVPSVYLVYSRALPQTYTSPRKNVVYTASHHHQSGYHPRSVSSREQASWFARFRQDKSIMS